MGRQIVDPGPGKNYNTTISAGDPHFEMEKRNIHRSRPNRSSFTEKSCSVSIKYESQITQKCFDSPLSSVKVSCVFHLGSRSVVTSSPNQIPLCAVVNIGLTSSNACRNARILSIEIIFSLMKSGKLVDFIKKKKILGLVALKLWRKVLIPVPLIEVNPHNIYIA